jgi:hypothetical protein
MKACYSTLVGSPRAVVGQFTKFGQLLAEMTFCHGGFALQQDVRESRGAGNKTPV